MAERFLPKWAKDEMEKKDRQIAELESELAKTRGETAEAPTAVVKTYAGDRRKDARPVAWGNERVRFIMGPDFDVDSDWVECYVDNGQLIVMGADMIALLPHSGNHARVVLLRPGR